MELHQAQIAGQTLSTPLQDRSDVITITSYALTGAFVIFFIARQIMKAVVFRKVALDDLFILLATTSGIGLSVTILLLASKGLGVHGLLTVERANTIMKGFYASELLYISTLCFSKLSILVLFHSVVVLRTHRFFIFGFGVSIFTWSAASVVAAAFQCRLPRPWEMMTLRCFNTQVFWVVYCAIDISTEIFIIMLSVDLVAHLRVRLSRKFAVVACFAPRSLVVAAALVRAVYFYQVTPHGNPEYDLWISTICTQAHVCISICTACIPYMVPFFKSLQGSIWRSYSTKGWNARSRSARLSGPPRNLLRKREANIRFESPGSFTSLVKKPERVSIVSPRIPSPTPISPFMPPPISTLRLATTSPNGIDLENPRCLSVSDTLYDSEVNEGFDIVSLQTAICFAPSPIEAPAQAHLSNVAIMDALEPSQTFALIGSPDSSNSCSCYSSGASTPTETEPHPRFSLFPEDAQQYTYLQPILQRDSSPLVHDIQHQSSITHDEAARLLTRRTLPNPNVLHNFDDFAHPARSASSGAHPKFSTTPRLHASPPTAVPSDQTRFP